MAARARRRAAASDERFRAFMENAPACVFIKDAAGRYLYMNGAAERLVGRKDWRGRTDEELLPLPTAREIRAHDRQVLDSGVPTSFELTLARADGGRHFHSTKFPVRDADGAPLVGSVTVDVTERQRSAEEMRLVLDTIAVDVVRCSRDMKYVWVNRAFAERHGRAPEDIVGRPIHELLGGAGFEAARPHFERVLAGSRAEYERLARYPRGERWIHAVAAPVRAEDGEVDGWVGVVADIHDRKLMEEALREADRRKDEFLATLGHELRNPLAPIRNAVALLGRPGVPEAELAWSREVIERQVEQLSRLIDDLLDIARIASGKLHLRRERVPLARVIDLALETSRPNIAAAGHALAVAPPAQDIAVEGDVGRLAQVFANLFNNAARYTEASGRIELRMQTRGGEVEVTVADNGIGFPPEVGERLFQPFSQLTEGDGRGRGGLGIGLALVQGIVALHGGSVRAESRGPGQGSAFTVRLPLAAQAPEGAQADTAVAMPEVDGTGMRVLVADDNRDAADTLQRILSLYGYQVRVTYDGTEALAAAGAFRPRAAVLDIGMPGMNGFELARALRERYGSATLLIAVTGWGQEDDRRRALEAGFDYHLTKPVDPGTLNHLLAQAGGEQVAR